MHCVFYFYTNTQPNGILFPGGLLRLAADDVIVITINTDASVAEDHTHE